MASKVAEARVKVRLLAAKDILAADNGKSSDPYCKLTVGAETFRSATQKKTLNPAWEEEFSFGCGKEALPDPLPELVVDCFDDDRFGKDKLGCVRIALSDLDVNVEVSASFTALALIAHRLLSRTHMALLSLLATAGVVSFRTVFAKHSLVTSLCRCLPHAGGPLASI